MSRQGAWTRKKKIGGKCHLIFWHEKGFTLRLSATLRDVKQNVCLITFISGHKSTRSNRRISERIHPGPLPLVFSAPKLRTNLPKDIRTTTNLRRFRVKQINVYMRKQSCKLASLGIAGCCMIRQDFLTA